MAVILFAKALYLCEEVDIEGGMTNLYALFNAMQPKAYPYIRLLSPASRNSWAAWVRCGVTSMCGVLLTGV